MIKIPLQPKTGFEQNVIQHKLNRNLIRFYRLLNRRVNSPLQNPKPYYVKQGVAMKWKTQKQIIQPQILNLDIRSIKVFV